MDCSPPDFSLHGVFQARILERVAISYSRGSSQLKDQTQISCIACIGSQILLLLGHLGNPSILYIVSTVYICQSSYPNISPPPSPLSVHTFVLYFCLYFFFANRLICTTFLQQKIAQHCKATILQKKKKYIQYDNFLILNSKITRKKSAPFFPTSQCPFSV